MASGARRTKKRGTKPAVRASAPLPQVVLASQTQVHAGPLPSAEQMQRYAALGLDGPIVRMAQLQQEHRMQLEMERQKADIAHQAANLSAQHAYMQAQQRSHWWGQVFGFVVAMLCVVAALYAGLELDRPVLASIFMAAPVAGIIRALRGDERGKE